MDTAALLEELAPLAHHDRMRRMVELGRRAAAGDAAAIEAIRGLSESPGSYARLLALQTVFGSRDGQRVIEALSDTSALVRRRARRIAPVFCDDAQAGAALAISPPGRARASLCRGLRKRGRAAVIDAFLAARLDGAERPDGKVVDLIAFGTEGASVKHAAALRDAGSPLAWMRGAIWQPAAAARDLEAMIASSEPLDPRQRWRLQMVLPALARRSPDAGLTVARAYLRKTGDPTERATVLALAVLARRRPRETFDLLREVHESSRPAHPPGAFGVVRFTHRAEALGVERLGYLIKLGGKPLPDGARGLHWFHRLSPSDRAALVEVWLKEGRGSWGAFVLRFAPQEGELAALREQAFERWSLASQDKHGAIQVGHLAWLPRDLREREARRHIERIPELVIRPRDRMEYARLLPFAEAKGALAPWLGHPEGEERAAALKVWIGAARFDRASVPDALGAVKARKFEQDPVRLAMLTALGDLPLGAMKAEHLADVGQCVKDALDASDLSFATSGAAERLVVRLFRRDAAWGTEWLSKLIQTRGDVTAPGLGDGLTKAEVAALAPAIGGLAQAWLTRERAGAILWLATSLGKRLPIVEDLVLALELCAQDIPLAGVAHGALGLLYRRARRSFAALVPKLLAKDKSFAIVTCVSRFVSQSRQDLLDPLLGDAPMRGRFATGRTSWVLDFGTGYARWTDRQQKRHADALLAVVNDASRDVPAILSAMETLFALAFIEPGPLLALAADARPPVREKAVRYLPRIDGGEGLPALVECLGDDRARFAIYALRRAFAELSPDEVLGVLSRAPMNKVTVAKEVLRLTGELSGEGAFRALLSFDRPDLHRDVRIALLRALWDHLDRDEAWAVLERAAQDPDWVLVSRLAEIPAGRLSAAAEARLGRLLAKVLERPEVEARLDLLRRAASMPLRDAERALFSACLARMGGPHPEEAKIALDAALHRMLPGEEGAVIGRMSELLRERRLLLGFVETLAPRLTPHASAAVMRVGRGLFDALRADPCAVPHALRLAPRLLGGREVGELFVELAKADLLHSDAMAAAIDAIGHTLHPDRLEPFLHEQPDPRLRRLGLVALSRSSGSGKGWSNARKDKLEVYRADPSPLVAGAAQFTFPPEPAPDKPERPARQRRAT